MNLQTKIKLKSQENNQIDYNSKLLLLGSCFSENIGDKFNYYKFQSTVNPFGILFHPKAIQELILNAINKKEYTEKDVFFNNEQWHCFDVHSKYSNALKLELIQDLNNQIELTNKQIKESTHIIITLGTAWVYKHIKTKTIVANCHKVSQKEFTKELLSVTEIQKVLQEIVASINKVNTKVIVVFTVSPVRHIKDGFIENTQSKAHLITAIHEFLNQTKSIKSSQSYYYPSFEIMMDELRDYRFYKEDMLHPNKIAVQYIWEKFQQVWMSSKTNKTMQEVGFIQKGLQHKPFNSSSQAHKQFLQQLENKISTLQKQFPLISF